MSAIELRSEPVHTLQSFLNETREQDLAGDAFANETARTLRVDVDGGVWLKPGATVAYRGDIVFERLPTIGAGSLTKALLREAAPLVRAVGKGRLYCGHHGAHVRVIELADERIVVSWQDLIAFQESLTFECRLVSHGVGVAAGGLVVVALSGHGPLAVATHGRPLTLQVSPDRPVSTDPHATLAWSAELTPTLKTDVSWRSAFGHGGQEPMQMFFEGTGFVVVQPYEDSLRFKLASRSLKRVVSLIAG